MDAMVINRVLLEELDKYDSAFVIKHYILRYNYKHMDIIGVILILTILVAFYKFFYNSNDNNKQATEKFAPIKFDDDYKPYTKVKPKKVKTKYCEKALEDDCIERMIKKKESLQVNPYFQEIQFHQDYRDTMNAFNLICNQKRVFNKQDLPIVKVSHPPECEIEKIVKRFIKELNKTVKNNVYEVAGQKLTGWDDNMPVTTVRKDTSWEKYQKELGLPISIYPEPAEKASVKLIKIDNIEKTETVSDARYAVHLIIQKKNVSDQMIVKVNFVINKCDTNLDREFFEEGKNDYNTSVVIEEISVVGYMIIQGFGRVKTSRETLYEFKGMNDGSDDRFTDGRLISDEDIIKQLNEKRLEIQKNFITGN